MLSSCLNSYMLCLAAQKIWENLIFFINWTFHEFLVLAKFLALYLAEKMVMLILSLKLSKSLGSGKLV